MTAIFLPPVVLAVPRVSWVYSEAADAIDVLRNCLPPGSVSLVHSHERGSIAAHRNALAEGFLDMSAARGIDYCLWIDSDMTPPPETAARLLTIALETDAAIVSALYFARRPPYEPNVGNLPATARGLREVNHVGFGCVLVHRIAFERIPRPWFEYPAYVEYGAGEDVLFCDKARARGLRIVADCDFDVGHLAVVPIDREFALAYQSTPRGQLELAVPPGAPMPARNSPSQPPEIQQ